MQKWLSFAFLVSTLAFASCGVEPEEALTEEVQAGEIVHDLAPFVTEGDFWKCASEPRAFYIRQAQCQASCATPCYLVTACLSNGRPVPCP